PEAPATGGRSALAGASGLDGRRAGLRSVDSPSVAPANRAVAQTLSPDTLARLAEAGLDPGRLPAHVAVIMDGHGRWAQERGLPRVEGHARGVGSVRATVEECCRLGVGQLTLYCLSSENWKRPQAELSFLMALLEQYLVQERAEILEQNIRFTVIG